MRTLLVILSILFLALQWRLWIGEHSFAELSQLRQAIEQQSQLNHQLQTDNSQIKALVYDLKTSLDAFEEISRLKLGLIQQQETFYLFSDQYEQ